jgi:hypothetical protein
MRDETISLISALLLHPRYLSTTAAVCFALETVLVLHEFTPLPEMILGRL